MILRNVLALRESINEYRQSMHEVAKKKGISDPSVIQISKQLDGKIIMLQKIMSDTHTPALSKIKSYYHDETSLSL